MKKKGFTLIELLAVIVILAITALITTPLVLKYIEYSKKEALKNNIMSIDRAILMKGTLERKDKEYTSLDELKMEINDFEMKVQYIDGVNRFYKIENDMYKLDISKCKTKEYCTIGEIKSIEDIIVKKDVIYSVVNDNNPGIICGEGLEEDTSISTCYIKSIEDLVALSTLVNKGTTFKDKTVELVENLDFNNKKSYANKKIDEALISGEGFTPIGGSKTFQGTFNGNDNTIKGLYINKPEGSGIGLFGKLSGAIIKNLKLTNSSISASSNSGLLIGYNYSSNIKYIEVNDIDVNLKSGNSGGVIGYNYSSNVDSIEAKKLIVNTNGTKHGGLIGTNENSVVTNIVLDTVKIVGYYNSIGGLIGSNPSGKIEGIKANNIEVECYGYCGGLIGSNNAKETVENIELNNINVKGTYDYVAGMVGHNSGDIESVKYYNVIVDSAGLAPGGLVGINSGASLKNIIGDNIKVGSNRYSAALAASSTGNISNIKLTNVEINGADRSGGLIGAQTKGSIYNVKIEGILKGSCYLGMIVGYCSTCNISNVVFKGKMEGSLSYIGGLVGVVYGTSETEVANISGVCLNGNITGKSATNRAIGNYVTYVPNLNTLASSSITVNGNTVESNDPTSLNGKSLDNMGKVSQSEYKALGFEFESTDTNEAYWYFNENDELDLIIKK